MLVKSTPFNQIDREYIISSEELRKKLGIEGQILTMGLVSARSPDDIKKGKSPEKDTWYITTKEVKPNSSN